MKNNESLDALAAAWIAAKQAETNAIQTRRKLEDRMVSLIGIAETFEGVTTAGDAYQIKVTSRMTRNVNGDLLQQLVTEAGISPDIVAPLFRWKAELNIAAWRQTADNIARALAPAITTNPGRPGFSIEAKEK